MLEKKIKNKIMEIRKLSLEKSNEDKNTVFVKFSGHSECLEIDIYIKGWKPNRNADFNKIWFLCNHSTEENIQTLDEIIEKLEKLNK